MYCHEQYIAYFMIDVSLSGETCRELILYDKYIIFLHCKLSYLPFQHELSVFKWSINFVKVRNAAFGFCLILYI